MIGCVFWAIHKTEADVKTRFYLKISEKRPCRESVRMGSTTDIVLLSMANFGWSLTRTQHIHGGEDSVVMLD